MYKNILVCSIYILFTIRIEKFCSKGISSIQGVRTFWAISGLFVEFSMINCFKCFLKYILWQNVLKVRQEKLGTILSLYMRICFKYFIKQISEKNQTRK